MKALPLGRAVIGLALAAALATSGCAAGRYAETAHEKTTLDGTNVQLHHIGLRGLSLDAPSSTYYLPGSAARIDVVLVNNGGSPDRLTGISTSVATGWAAFSSKASADSVHAADNASASSLASGAVAAPSSAAGSTAPALPQGTRSVRIAPGERVSYGVPDATGGLLLTGMRGKVYPGTTVRIAFTFAKAGTIKVLVPVKISNAQSGQTIGNTKPTLGA